MAYGLKLMNSFLTGLSKERFQVAIDGGLVTGSKFVGREGLV